MSNYSTPATSVVFIDLATFSEQEGFLYGGPNARTWFVRGVQKSNWFSYVPIQLRCNGTQDFGQKNSSASINRSGDYVLHVWFRTLIPQVVLGNATTGPQINNDASIRWCANLMHNIFEKVTLTHNELTVMEFDSFWLDFNTEFRLSASKALIYNNMIGNISSMTAPVGTYGPTLNTVTLGPSSSNILGEGRYFTCPLPFWFCEDSGVASPVAALPFNDIKVNYTFRSLDYLLILDPGHTGGRAALYSDVQTVNISNSVGGATTVTPSGILPSFVNPQTFAHYAVVHNDERVKMGDAPRDMLIFQVQNVQATPFKDVTTNSSFDLRLSHSIVAFFFAARNTSVQGEWSNYTTLPQYFISAPVTYSGGNPVVGVSQNSASQSGSNPLADTALLYENSVRLAMGSDYYMWTQPWYMSDAGGSTGYHMWSYALQPWLYNPTASTNYSKLANVSIVHTCSSDAINAANTVNPTWSGGSQQIQRNTGTSTVAFPQSFAHIFVAKNWNIARVANGSLGHPTL